MRNWEAYNLADKNIKTARLKNLSGETTFFAMLEMNDFYRKTTKYAKLSQKDLIKKLERLKKLRALSNGV